MSTNLPPQGPGPQDPAHRDPSDGPEYLSSPGGAPLEAGRGPGRGRRTALLAGTGVVVAGLVGGGAWAVTSFFGTGAQPAEALPASTLAYASIDLDPSGEQKIEAVRLLREFPGFRDRVGLETDDDVRRYLFEQIAPEAGCEGLDYDDDVEPWLGSRAAVAAVEGADGPAPVLVLQVSDAEAADAGLMAIQECAGDTDGTSWVVEGDWAVVAENEEAAADVVEAAAEGTLADDADFNRWADEVGDAGVVNLYAAPAVGDLLLEVVEGAPGGGDLPDGFAEGFAFGLAPGGELPEQVREQLEAFDGAAATIRFDDGAVELEVAGSGPVRGYGGLETDRGADVVETLPEDTAVALGIGFPDGWTGQLLEQLEAGPGAQLEMVLGLSLEELLAEAEAASGLELPEDVEALLGDSAALALGGDFSVEDLLASDDGSQVPVGVKIQGDGEEVERVLGELDEAFGLGEVLGSDRDGDTVAVGPNADYRERLLEDGGLGDSEVYQDVVPESDDAAAVLFVDFDAGDWLDEAVREGTDDAVLAENLEPLSGAGLSSWVDDETGHLLLRITTD